MCGICGIVHADAYATADPGAIRRMSAVQAHRGPDDSGLWTGGPAAFGHQRLSILDLSSAGHQPMLSADGGMLIVFNGEIYNFQELRGELERKGCSFRSQCDTEVLLEAHRCWGDAAVERLNGIFAYAVYDIPCHRLLLVRDRLGVKPLFYAQSGGCIAFASELEALMQSGIVPRKLNPPALDAYLRYLYIPAPATIYTGVHKLLPGEMLVFEKGVESGKRYWQLQYAPSADWTLDSAAARYKELLADAVRMQRISDAPIGAFLSGGIDSSTVTGLLSAASGNPVKTFTIGFDDAHYSELQYARTAARHFGTDHTEAMLSVDAADLILRLPAYFGEPFGDSSALPTYLVSQTARSSVTVALSGDGGDELFAGYQWLHMALAATRYRRVPAGIRHAAAGMLRLLPASPLREKLLRFHQDALQSPDEAFRGRITTFRSDARATLYMPDFADALRQHDSDPFAVHAQAGAALNDADRMLYIDTMMYLPDDILCKVDRMSMAHGLEARVPILDHRIVEFAATVPFSLKYAGGVSKRLVKHAFKDMLPPELLKQRKQGFAIPIHKWFRETLGSLYRDSVLAPDARCRTLIRQDAACHLLEAHRRGQEAHGHHLYVLLFLELWLRHVESAMPLGV